MVNHVIQPESVTILITPDLFQRYAREYVDCYRSYRASLPYSPVPDFLLSRAIELELKATHLESKSRDEVKQRYGHNLKKTYDELPLPRRVLDANEYTALCAASEIYNDKGFEYVEVKDAVTGLRDFPDLAMLRRIAEKLIR